MDDRPPKPYASAAARQLLAEGLTQGYLAARLGVSRRAVGFYLDGTVRQPKRLRGVLVGLLGEDGAERVLVRVPSDGHFGEPQDPPATAGAGPARLLDRIRVER